MSCLISKPGLLRHILHSLRLFFCWNDRRAFLSKGWKHFTPVPPSGGEVNCSVVEITSALNHLCACHESFRFWLNLICASQICWNLSEADNVLGSHHFGVLSAATLFKMCAQHKEPLSFSFHFLAFSLDPSTLPRNVCCYDNSVWLVRWRYSFGVAVWAIVRGGRQAVRQRSLMNPLITTRGGWTRMNKLTTDCVCH